MIAAQNQNNNQAQSNTQSQQSDLQKQSQLQPSTGQKVTTTTIAGKEHEAVKITAPEALREVSREAEIPEELERVGVKKIGEQIYLPPDIKKLRVKPTGTSAPVVQTAVLPQVSLPISDKKVIKGLHEPIISAFHWLAIWCIRKLKKVHIALKVIHGKIVRVKTN